MGDDPKPPEVNEQTFREWFDKYEAERTARNPVPPSGSGQQPKSENTTDVAAAVEAALAKREANSKRESRLSALEQSNTDLKSQVDALKEQIKKAGKGVFSIFN